jgi:hypothetical protein
VLDIAIRKGVLKLLAEVGNREQGTGKKDLQMYFVFSRSPDRTAILTSIYY